MKLEAAKPLKNPGGCLKELDHLYLIAETIETVLNQVELFSV